jgi:hypothetical protein
MQFRCTQWRRAYSGKIKKVYKFLKRYFARKVFEDDFKIKKLQNDLLEHRKIILSDNFCYYTAKSTKYMSKWIEEKNKQLSWHFYDFLLIIHDDGVTKY